jgi:predicted dehydrogenase
MTLGIALLGTGNIAQRAFVPAVHAVDAARLVAVLSRDKASSAQAREAPLRVRAKPLHSNRRIRSSAK